MPPFSFWIRNRIPMLGCCECSVVTELHMIPAADFEELVYTCTQMLQSPKADIVGAVAETIHADANYAAMTVMAFYKAADELSIDTDEIDAMIGLAEKNCSPIRVSAYQRIFKKFQTFERVAHTIQISEDHFFVPPTYIIN